MIRQVSNSEFIDDLFKDDYANWSYEGADALYEFLTELEEDMGEQIEFDRVALRCEYSEYENLEDILSQYDNINTLEDLKENTIVIEFKYGTNSTPEKYRKEGYIIQNF
tara:strand:+ start:403 stop:729 length:327 start_codon:yes stop_codon:yes gene_type:complete